MSPGRRGRSARVAVARPSGGIAECGPRPTSPRRWPGAAHRAGGCLDTTSPIPSPSADAGPPPSWRESGWKRLLDRIRDGDVVPVLGPQLLVEADGRTPRQARIAQRVLQGHGIDVDPGSLTPFRELDEAHARLASSSVSPQDIYADVHEEIRHDALDGEAPEPIRQIAEITDFRLLVTLTPDDWLRRCLRQCRAAVHEVVHSPRWPTSEFDDLPRDWPQRAGEAQLLYLFGKSRATPTFALHDEDLLEYAHNMIAGGSGVPRLFLDELRERSLLLIGCHFPDWLGRFFLRVTNKSRLSEKGKREWMVEQLQPGASLVAFLRSHSRETEVVSQLPPAAFVAELHRRWRERSAPAAAPPAGGGTQAKASAVPSAPLFFISYSRTGDLPHAEALVQALLELGVPPAEIWFDRTSIEPGQDFAQRILDGIRGCRYFVPLLSASVDEREEAFVFREWRAANERLQGMNRAFVVPVVVDPDFAPERYAAEPVRAWRHLDFGRAPLGRPDEALRLRFLKLLRRADRGSKDSL